MNTSSTQLLDYWFSDAIKPYWFNANFDIDLDILNRYQSLWEAACLDKLKYWSDKPKSALALVILLDQLPLNMFRGQAKCFQSEYRALNTSIQAIQQKFDQKLTPQQRVFLYMPLMHSEQLDKQDLSVKLYKTLGIENNLKFAKHHRDIVKKFGRFPHRNAILNRKSTQEELRYLNSKQAFTG